MAKNKMIHQMMAFQQKTNSLVPAIYAAIAIVLHENCGCNQDTIEEIFALSQNVWEELGTSEKLLEECEKLTGIELRAGDKR